MQAATLSADEFDLANKTRLGEGSFGVAYKIAWRGKGDFCVKCIPLRGINQFAFIYYFLLIGIYSVNSFRVFRGNLNFLRKLIVLMLFNTSVASFTMKNTTS